MKENTPNNHLDISFISENSICNLQTEICSLFNDKSLLNSPIQLESNISNKIKKNIKMEIETKKYNKKKLINANINIFIWSRLLLLQNETYLFAIQLLYDFINLNENRREYQLNTKDSYNKLAFVMLSISSKSREYYSITLKQFQYPILKNKFQCDDIEIHNLELKVLMKFNFKIPSTTIFDCLIFYSCRWDFFLSFYNKKLNNLFFNAKLGCVNFYKILQIINAIFLDPLSQEYSKEIIVMGSIFIFILKEYERSTQKKISKEKYLKMVKFYNLNISGSTFIPNDNFILFYDFIKYLKNYGNQNEEWSINFQKLYNSLSYFYKYIQLIYSKETLTDVSNNENNKYLLCCFSDILELGNIIEDK